MSNMMIEQIAIFTFLLVATILAFAWFDTRAEKKLIRNIKNKNHLNSH
ncbi:hypothetical protein [Alkalimarinus alittae]|uniref:Uncharacterized protein n=1 Tax=Alkalimarinus alittae TaxID=2961619 RepID=A0ABY6N558_9ALTE|nr:hypothetical protein [Alkalimarinus alittae]UZE97253.1 hypothetical protein NKI27_05750 [Alkalimarinus alittae]